MKHKPRGLYLADGTFTKFAETADVSALLSGQIATRATASGVTSVGMLLPNPDPVLRKIGKSIQVYRDLRADGHVGGCIRRRKAAVKSLLWGFDRDKASSKIAANIEAIFKDLDMERIIGEMHDAAFYGYQPLEIIWGTVGGSIVPTDVVGKPAEWFAYDDENQPRFRSKNTPFPGDPLPDMKFLIPRQDASYDNPYGQPDLSRCFWPTKFKQGGMDFWFKFVEKYGTPWVIGKSPRSTDDGENERLLDMLEQMVQDAVAVIPDDASVEIIEAAGKAASGDIHEKFLRHMRAEVSIALLGQNQTTEANTTNASAKSGLEVTGEIRDEDKKLICACVNELVGWICDLNFNGERPKFEMWEEESVDVTLAERDAKLASAGARFTNAYYQRAYNLQATDLALPVPPAIGQSSGNVPGQMPTFPSGTPGLSFSEAGSVVSSGSAAPDYATQNTDKLAQLAQPVIDDWIVRIRALLDQAPDLPSFQDAVLAEFDHLPDAQLAQVMGDAFTAANLAGRAEVASNG